MRAQGPRSTRNARANLADTKCSNRSNARLQPTTLEAFLSQDL